MKKVDLTQSGEGWLEWRQKGIGGSDAYTIMEDTHWISPEELLQVKLGKKKVVENAAMSRGKRLEPIARQAYMDLTGIQVVPVCVISDQYPWMRASLDGLSLDGEIVLEIKCPNDYAHKQALDGFYPRYYRAQLQHELLVTQAKLLHYFSYTDSLKYTLKDRFALVPVQPDLDYWPILLRREREFYERMMGEPSHP
jgi:putative phage-type endonuclease